MHRRLHRPAIETLPQEDEKNYLVASITLFFAGLDCPREALRKSLNNSDVPATTTVAAVEIVSIVGEQGSLITSSQCS